MLKCAEVQPEKIRTYYLPFHDNTASKVHADTSHISKVVSYQSDQVKFENQAAAFSIKCCFGGRVTYVVDGRHVTVEEDQYFLVNHNHAYHSYVKQSSESQVFSLFFGKPLLDDVYQTLTSSDEERLDDPTAPNAGVEFFESLQNYNPAIKQCLDRLYQQHQSDDMSVSWLDEQFHGILGALLVNENSTKAKIRALPMAKESTRQEVYRRVSHARDYMHSNYAEPIGLEDMAEQAHMAPHHFLRSFKKVTGSTPHQSLLRLRLRKGHALLSRGMTVADTAYSVGFESWEQFSRQFRRHFKTTPGAVRKNSA
jgi:AraC family transcriptional regulator